ncbi:uncharacterized protein LOC129718166 isoform X2 [Wyeomyia smithii]|uniref:uncharacterized protein LOC129718166 isoform X2 n=1 Tax=Wyeomyia smithii TaxID=174621 RepID=UPI002467DEF8|nr:uncharacterized protein LOC129718166 isoform X2 [Wyeomyia smithii]
MSSVPVWLVAALCVVGLLLSFAEGTKEPEIDLKVATHARKADGKVPKGSNFAESIMSRERKGSLKQAEIFPRKELQEHGKSPKSMYDKKYFDYLSTEVKDSTGAVGLSKRINSRRIRRNADQKQQTRTRRNGIWYVEPVGAYSFVMPQRVYPNDWRLQYDPYDLSYRPNLHNQYLPPVTRPVYPEQPTDAPLGPGFEVDPGTRFGENPNTVPNTFAFDIVYDQSRDRTYTLMRTTKKTPGATTPNSIYDRPVTTTRPPFTPGPVRVMPQTTQGTTTTPRPSIQHNSEDEFDWSSIGLSVGGTDADGQNNKVSNPDNRPTATNGNTPQGSNRNGPSKCTWAIANCCSHNSDRIRYYCFEQNQCFGSFWGDNVCRRYYQEALREIENFYNV